MKENKCLVILGELIKRIRLEKGLTTTEVTVKTIISSSYVSQIEYGKRNISIVMLLSIIDALEVSYEDFFKELEEELDKKKDE